MILRDLNRAEREAYEDTLRSTEIQANIEVTIRDQDEKPIGSLTADTNWERATYQGVPGIIDGQVDVDWESDVTHQLGMTVSDPHLRLDFKKDSPARGALFVDKMIQVQHLLEIPGQQDSQACGLFWGPITRFRHDGFRVEIEAMGKEVLALDPHVIWKTIHIRKGTYVTDAIKRIMRSMGERRFDFPNVKGRLHRPLSLKKKEAWRVCTRLANSIDCMLFYDGDGKLRLRRYPESPAFHFKDGQNGTLLTHPALIYDIDRVRNVVEVLGAKPEKGIERIRAIARAHPSHPLSPEKLARNDEPRIMLETIENDIVPRTRTIKVQVTRKGKKERVDKEKAIWESVVRKRKQAKRIAERRLKNLLVAFLDAEYEIIIHPHMELLDLAKVDSVTAGQFNHQLRSWSFPLRGGPGMVVGTNKRIRYGLKKKHHHRLQVTGGQSHGAGPRFVHKKKKGGKRR